MPTRYSYDRLPYAGPPRHVPSYANLGQLMGLQAQNQSNLAMTQAQIAQQKWAALGQMFDRFVQGRHAKKAAEQEAALQAEARAQQAREKAEERAFRVAEFQQRTAEREDAAQRAREAATRQTERDAVIDAHRLADDTLPGVVSSEHANLMKPSGRVQVIEGVPVLMRTPVQIRQATTDKRLADAATAAAKDREADNTRQREQFDEAKRHNKAMEQRERNPVDVVVQGPDGPYLLDRGANTTKRVLGPDGQPLGPATSASERMDSRKFSKSAPVLKSINELSGRINTQQGVYAKMAGGAAKIAAKANLDDDVAEYEALVLAFTPMIARALGHTGILTEQDVVSSRAMFPKPGDSKSLRDRKISRMMTIIGELEGIDGVVPESPTPKAAPSTPDLAGLQRGRGRRFSEGPFAGQTWTLGPDGQPRRVQ